MKEWHKKRTEDEKQMVKDLLEQTAKVRIDKAKYN